MATMRRGGGGGGLAMSDGRYHRVQKRQGDGDAGAAQERAAGKRMIADEACHVSPLG